jgi:neuromedin U receptor 1
MYDSSSNMATYEESIEDDTVLLSSSSPETYSNLNSSCCMDEGGPNCCIDDTSGNNTRYLNITTEIPIEYALPLYGYCVPFLFVITIIANVLVVVVLAKRHMRTPTNVVLMAMAISDMLTVLFPAPWLLYMYTFGNHYKPFYPIAACYAWSMMNETIPNLFHTASIWLTLALAVQRYIYVCHAPVARTWCTMPRVLKGICYIYGVAFLHQSTRFVDRVYVTTEIIWEGEVRHVCTVEYAHWVEYAVTLDVYFNCYFWFRVIFIHLIPCVSLILLNLLLFRAMRQAQLKRLQLFKDNKKSSECKKMRDSNSTTIMLIVVVTVFLLVEVPLAVLTILHIISSTLFEFLDYNVVNVCILFSNFFIIVSYPINFAIYCGMSRQFRETFKDLFIRGSSTARRNGSSRYSLVNGPRTCTNETVL